jgi:hypothetical protein
LAWVAVSVALSVGSPVDVGAVSRKALFDFGTVMMILAVLAVALVAVARAISPWLAYPASGFAAVAIVSVLGLVSDPFRWRAFTPPPQLLADGRCALLLVGDPVSVRRLYAYVSSATHDAKVLHVLEAERAAEAERLARQRLQTELATVDHVLSAMRRALIAPAREAAQADGLLEAVTAYLRVAQQRGSSEPERVAAALRKLKEVRERQR